MEHFQMLREQAKKKLGVADHMLSMTYPLVKDPKILVAGLQNVFESLELGITSILEYERAFKRIMPYPSSFEGKLIIFQHKVAPRYGLDKENVRLIRDIHELLSYRKKSDIEFIRKDKFVMSDKEYNLKTLDYEKVKEFVSKTKIFLKQLSELTSKNDRIFN